MTYGGDDTVNTASRLESHDEPGKVHVSEAVYQKLKNTYIFQERVTIEIKGKGWMSTLFYWQAGYLIFRFIVLFNKNHEKYHKARIN